MPRSQDSGSVQVSLCAPLGHRLVRITFFSGAAYRLTAKLRYDEVTAESGGNAEGAATTVEASVHRTSISTFERLQEDIIELESNKRRLRRSVDQLRDEQHRLARRLELAPRNSGKPAQLDQCSAPPDVVENERVKLVLSQSN